MKTFETEKHNIPEGATHYIEESDETHFAWLRIVGGDAYYYSRYIRKDWIIMEDQIRVDEYDVRPIPQTKEAEWVNGEECIYKGETCLFIGEIPIKNSSLRAECIIQHKAGAPLPVTYDELSKPETKEDREKREELEAAYDLYCEFINGNSVDATCMSSYSFSQSLVKVKWLAIVRKTGYRKEK